MTNPTIKIGVRGRVVKGQGHGSFIRIEEDRPGSGSHLVLWGHDPEFGTGSDNWVEDRSTLERLFEELCLVVHWDLAPADGS